MADCVLLFILCKSLKSPFLADKDAFVQRRQYHAFWYTGYAKCLSITSHCTDPVQPEYFGSNTKGLHVSSLDRNLHFLWPMTVIFAGYIRYLHICLIQWAFNITVELSVLHFTHRYSQSMKIKIKYTAKLVFLMALIVFGRLGTGDSDIPGSVLSEKHKN